MPQSVWGGSGKCGEVRGQCGEVRGQEPSSTWVALLLAALAIFRFVHTANSARTCFSVAWRSVMFPCCSAEAAIVLRFVFFLSDIQGRLQTGTCRSVSTQRWLTPLSGRRRLARPRTWPRPLQRPPPTSRPRRGLSRAVIRKCSLISARLHNVAIDV